MSGPSPPPTSAALNIQWGECLITLGGGCCGGRETGSVFSAIPWPQHRTSPRDAALRGGEARETKSGLGWIGLFSDPRCSADTGTVKGLRSRKGQRSSEVRPGSRTLPLSLLLQQGRPAAVRVQLRCATRATARNPRHLQAALVRLSAGLGTPLRLCGVGAAQSDSTRIFADPVRRPAWPLPAGRVIKRLGSLVGVEFSRAWVLAPV